MNSIESSNEAKQRLTLLRQLTAAETALRIGLHVRGFGNNAREHMERAKAHLCEAYIAINETRSVRTVHQLVDDLNRVEQVLEDGKRRKSQRV